VFAILIVGALIVDAGLLSPRSGTAVGGEGPGASGEPGGPGGPGQSAPPPPDGDVVLVAKNSAFDKAELTVPAAQPFTIGFQNLDAGVTHDVAIQGESGIEFNGEDLTTAGSITYEVPALDAGTYRFLCTFHASMTGTLTAGG